MSYVRGAPFPRWYESTPRPPLPYRVFAYEIPYVTENYEVLRTPVRMICDILDDRIVWENSRIHPGLVQHMACVKVVEILERDSSNVFQLRVNQDSYLNQEKWSFVEAVSLPVAPVIEPVAESVTESVAASGTAATTSVFDCVICSETMKEPCTISCGHSFCKACIGRWISTGSEASPCYSCCPCCRAAILETPKSLMVSVCLQNAVVAFNR